MKRLVRENRRQASVGGGSQRYKVESCDTPVAKVRSNGEYKADLSIEGVLSTRQQTLKSQDLCSARDSALDNICDLILQKP